MIADTTRHLYIHVPFCGRRCSYCDFSIAVRREVPATSYVESIIREVGVRTNSRVELETIYLGGGTPSKLPPDSVQRLVTELSARSLTLSPTGEATLEANPEDITPEAAETWLQAGFNRLSVGVQTFSPGVLEWMHRTHAVEQSEAGVRAARSAGFENISVDLIYALPDRLGRDWGADVDRAIALEPDHLSVYGLTVEPRTPLGKWTARGSETPESDDRAADQFLEAHERLAAAGYKHYEVSSYARPGRRSRHNSAYWRRVPYLGLGPSAHSYDGVRRRWNTAAYAEWSALLDQGADPLGGTEELDATHVDAETLYLDLRTDTGAALTGRRLEAAVSWASHGWAMITDRVRLTPEGWLRLDALVAELMSSAP